MFLWWLTLVGVSPMGMIGWISGSVRGFVKMNCFRCQYLILAMMGVAGSIFLILTSLFGFTVDAAVLSMNRSGYAVMASSALICLSLIALLRIIFLSRRHRMRLSLQF